MEDTKFKKTTLNDDALIYQRSKDSVDKNDLKNLPLNQKLVYFKDYYLRIVIAVILVIIAVASILNTTIFNRSECVLSIFCLNDASIYDSDSLDSFFEENIGMENKNQYVSIESFLLDNYQMTMAYTARLAAGGADIIICSYEDFVQQAGNGAFQDLGEFLPAEVYDELSDKILESSITEKDTEGNILSEEEPLPFGIDLSVSELYKQYGGYSTTPVLCVAHGSANVENVLKAISYFTTD